MTNPVRLSVTGSDATGTDAPSVDDLFDQIRDFVEVLRGVERAISDDRSTEIVWRVTGATMNSPIAFELTPFASNPAIFIGARADMVEKVAVEGLIALAAGDPRPPYFTDDVLPKALRMHNRVLNGLAETRIDLGGEQVKLDRATSRRVAAAVAAEKALAPTPYRELDSVEGHVTKAELDGYGRAILRFKARLNGAEIKAVATGKAFQQVETLRLSDIWQGVRVRVYGAISYKDLGQIDGLTATSIELLDQTDLPGIDDIHDENFTGGLSTADFLEAGRNG